MKEEKMKITGMTCSACSSRVGRVTKKTNAVENTSVNLATEKLNITFDEDKIKNNYIKNIFEKAGYKLIVEEKKNTKKEIEPYKKLWYRFIGSLIFTLPLLIISMGCMIGRPLPKIIDSMENPMNFALLQLVLTIPVMIIGYKFYVLGFRNLIKLSPNMDLLFEFK